MTAVMRQYSRLLPASWRASSARLSVRWLLRVDALWVVCHTDDIGRDPTHHNFQMTTFLTKAQRDFLCDEYRDQLEDMEELEEYGYLVDELRTYDNVAFWQTVIEVMPLYAEPVGRKILSRIMINRQGLPVSPWHAIISATPETAQHLKTMTLIEATNNGTFFTLTTEKGNTVEAARHWVTSWCSFSARA